MLRNRKIWTYYTSLDNKKMVGGIAFIINKKHKHNIEIIKVDNSNDITLNKNTFYHIV